MPPLADAIERGDIVTLKTDPGTKYVVLGFFVAVPTYYLVRHVSDEREIVTTVRRCEIASVERPAPLSVPHGVEPDWRDAPAPSWSEEYGATEARVKQAQAQAQTARPAIVWKDVPDIEGQIWSSDNRFVLDFSTTVGWHCHDFESGTHSREFANIVEAKKWAERRLLDLPSVIVTEDDGEIPF